MSEIRVASRYAKALIDLAIERNELEAIKADMNLFTDTLKGSSELQAVLKNPIVPQDKKAGILKDLFASKVNAATQSFFNIMVSKSRAGVLYETGKEFIRQYNDNKGIITATVVSATAITADAEAKMIEAVVAATGKQVVLVKKVDADLIGGFVLTVGDKQFDTSIAKSLVLLKKEFNS